MWDERVERAGKEKLEDADIQRTYKGYIAVSLQGYLAHKNPPPPLGPP